MSQFSSWGRRSSCQAVSGQGSATPQQALHQQQGGMTARPPAFIRGGRGVISLAVETTPFRTAPRVRPLIASALPRDSSGSSSDWEAKAPLRTAVESSRSRSSEAAPASAAVAEAILGDPSQDTLPTFPTVELQDPLPATPHPTNATQLEVVSSGPGGGRGRNAAAVNLGVIAVLTAVAAAKFISVDIDSWDHLSVWELLRQMPESNWRAYDAAVNSNPLLTKACISGAVYTLGDCIAQGYEGRKLEDLDRGRVLRSGTCGFIAHGPLSHLYYENLDYLFNHVLMVPPTAAYLPFIKLGIDQTIWSVFWNSLYYTLLGALKLERPAVILKTVQSSWFDLLKAGWKLWPFAHVITYCFIPVQHRLLWVDSVELVWVTFLSLYGQQKRDEIAAQEVHSTLAGPAVIPVEEPAASSPSREIRKQ